MKYSIRKTTLLACSALIASIAASTHSFADTTAYTTTGTDNELDLGNYGPAGFEFTLNENIDVTQLGFTGISLGGDAPSVTLWSVGAGGALSQIYNTGNIISDITSNPGPNNVNPGPVVAPTYVSVGTPIALAAGSTYLVTATAYWAPTFNSSDIQTSSAFSSSAFLTNPNQGASFFADNNWGYSLSNISDLSPVSNTSETPTTPNFQFTAVEAPEPSTDVMMGIGLALLIFRIRRRATRATP